MSSSRLQSAIRGGLRIVSFPVGITIESRAASELNIVLRREETANRKLVGKLATIPVRDTVQTPQRIVPHVELQDAEEVDEVLFLLVSEPDLEAAIEEVDQFGQIAGGTVGEVGRTGGDSAKLLHHKGADIRAFSSDESTAGVLS